MEVNAERKLKGINFIGTIDALGREHGMAARESVVAALEGEVGEAVRHGSIVSSGWYPASWYDALLRTILKEVDGDAATARALSREAVKADFQTLFKIVRLFLTPHRALQQSMRISSRYIDGGVIEVVGADDGFMHLKMREYYGYSRLMWWDFIGAVEGVLENIGAEDISARFVAGGGDGDDHLEVVLRWR